MKIVGIDLAWQSEANTTAIAVAQLDEEGVHISSVQESLAGLDAIIDAIDKEDNVHGLAIDAPLVIKNPSGQRDCEKELSKEYGSRLASCHASNTTLYPNSSGTVLSKYLSDNGFGHLGEPTSEKWQIECYPHPALIEILGLSKRLSYKKGKVAERKQGQVYLANYLKSLAHSNTLKLTVDGFSEQYLSEENIRSKSGAKLKENEDSLDAIICVYVGALYASSVAQRTFGTIEAGYIYVPKQKCI